MNRIPRLLVVLAVFGAISASPPILVGQINLDQTTNCCSQRYDPFPCGPQWIPTPLRALIPQGFAGADFRDACRAHDYCYGLGCRPRRECDDRFLQNLIGECDNSIFPRLCRRRARVMHFLTDRFGGASYRQHR